MRNRTYGGVRGGESKANFRLLLDCACPFGAYCFVNSSNLLRLCFQSASSLLPLCFGKFSTGIRGFFDYSSSIHRQIVEELSINSQ